MAQTQTRPVPTPTDGFPTNTSRTQAETEEVLLRHAPSHLSATTTTSTSKTESILNKTAHMQYLVRNLVQGFPSRYISQDASQPWLMFWSVQALSVLQVALDPGNRQRIVDKVMTWQHPEGGFGGGPGQAAHLLGTYASVCTLAIVGSPGETGGWDRIDREKLYAFFLSLKQPDGSFLVAHHSEVDVRGIYCLLIVASLLDILTPELVKGTPEFLASCQTYEGGFASSSFLPPGCSSFGFEDEATRLPLGEAHGGYTFCALASWVILQPYISSPYYNIGHPNPNHPNIQPQINIPNLLRWLSSLQGIPIELGGFKGRTNKLVDGCYSWWCGGAFGLLEALGVGGLENARSEEVPFAGVREEGKRGGEVWDDVDEGLYNRKALQEYILYAGQHPAGGLRDKPPKHADAYHTLYCLSGLSSAQHHVFPSKTRKREVEEGWVGADGNTDNNLNEIEKQKEEGKNALRRAIFSDLLSWTEEEGGSHVLGGAANRLNATHPITNLTITHTEAIMGYFYKQKVPPRPRPGVSQNSKNSTSTK